MIITRLIDVTSRRVCTPAHCYTRYLYIYNTYRMVGFFLFYLKQIFYRFHSSRRPSPLQHTIRVHVFPRPTTGYDVFFISCTFVCAVKQRFSRFRFPTLHALGDRQCWGMFRADVLDDSCRALSTADSELEHDIVVAIIFVYGTCLFFLYYVVFSPVYVAVALTMYVNLPRNWALRRRTVCKHIPFVHVWLLLLVLKSIVEWSMCISYDFLLTRVFFGRGKKKFLIIISTWIYNIVYIMSKHEIYKYFYVTNY